MKIEYYDCCTTAGIEVDDKNFYSELSYDEQKEILHKLTDKVSEDTLYGMLKKVCEDMGKFVDMGYCDECGDYNYKYILEV